MQQFILRKSLTSALLIMAISSNALFTMEPTQKITSFDFGKGELQHFNNLQDVCYTIINSMADDAVIFGQTNKQNNSAVKKLGWSNLLNLNNDPYHNLNFIRNNYVPVLPIDICMIYSNGHDRKLLFNLHDGESCKPNISSKQYILAINPCQKKFYINLDDEQNNNTDLWNKFAEYEKNVINKFIDQKKALNNELIKQKNALPLDISSLHPAIANGQPLTQLFFCQNEDKVKIVLNQCKFVNEGLITTDFSAFEMNNYPYWDLMITLNNLHWDLITTLLTLIQYSCYKNNAFELSLKEAKNLLAKHPKHIRKHFQHDHAFFMFALLFRAKEVNNLKACYQLITIDPFNTVANPLDGYSNPKQILDLLIENNFDENIINHFKKCGGKTNQETNENSYYIMNIL
jgi:hypothetical protein